MGKNNTDWPTVGTKQHLRGEIGQYNEAEVRFSHKPQPAPFLLFPLGPSHHTHLRLGGRARRQMDESGGKTLGKGQESMF